MYMPVKQIQAFTTQGGVSVHYFERLKNNVLTKMALSYSILAVTLIGIIAVFLINRTNDLMVHELSTQSQYRLEKVRSFTEQALLKKYEDTFSNKVYPTLDTNLEGGLYYFLDNGRRNNERRIVSLVRSLNVAKYAYTETDNITIHFLKENFLVDNSYYYENPNSHKDREFIRTLPELAPHRWFLRQTPEGKDLLTYIYTLPYKSVGHKIKGYMYIDMSVENIRQLYLDMMHTAGENIYVFDESGQLILSLLGSNPDELSMIAKLRADSALSYMLSRGADGTKVVSLANAGQSLLGWSYAIARPMDSLFLSSNWLRVQIFVICSVVLILGVIVSYLLSRRFYLPLKRILFNIRNLYGIPRPFHQANEYNFIDSTLRNLDRKVVSLQNELKTKQLHQLIDGRVSDLRGELQIPLDCRYVACIVELAEGEVEDFLALFDRARHSLPNKAFRIRDGRAVALFFPSEDESDATRSIVRDMEKFMLMSKARIRLRCAVGDAVASLEDIRRSYLGAEEAFGYFFLYPDRSVVSWGEYADRRGLTSLFQYEQFENSLKAGDMNAVDCFLRQFAAALDTNRVNMEAVQLSLVQLVSALARTIIELNLPDRTSKIAELFSDYRKKTLEETLNWFRGFCAEVALYLNRQAKNMHEELIYELKAYIDANFHEDISLDILSERAGLTSSYISTLFGEVMGVSFSEYLTSLRLKRATDLLLTGNAPVKEIAMMTGYRNVQYFCTKFKDRYGVTPIQYRNSRQPLKEYLQTASDDSLM